MRFHLIDRIDAVEPHQSVVGRKVTSLSEEYWEERDGELEMPPPLVLEAFCQAGTWLIMISTERRKRAALLQVGSVTWHKAVRPGDVLMLNGEIDSFGEETGSALGHSDDRRRACSGGVRGHVCPDRRRHARPISRTPSVCRTC